VRFPCVHAIATTPARQLGASSARFPSRISLPRYGSRVGPRIDLFEACSAFTRVTACTLALPPYFVARIAEGFNRFVTSAVAPVASGWSIFAGWDFHPLGKRRLFTAHAKSGLTYENSDATLAAAAVLRDDFECVASMRGGLNYRSQPFDQRAISASLTRLMGPNRMQEVV